MPWLDRKPICRGGEAYSIHAVNRKAECSQQNFEHRYPTWYNTRRWTRWHFHFLWDPMHP